jgi:predicted nucleic-acid-binding Zn-ribbon protein
MEKMLVALGGTNYLDLVIDSLSRFRCKEEIESQHAIAYVSPLDYDRILKETLYLSSVKLDKSGDLFTMQGAIRKDGGMMLGLCEIRHVDYILERCKNCKHWKQVSTIYATGFNIGDCLHPMVVYEKIVIDAGNCDSLEIHLKEDFGCIHFESKQ